VSATDVLVDRGDRRAAEAEARRLSLGLTIQLAPIGRDHDSLQILVVQGESVAAL